MISDVSFNASSPRSRLMALVYISMYVLKLRTFLIFSPFRWTLTLIGTRQVIDPTLYERFEVIVHAAHAELLEIRCEGDLGEVITLVVRYLSFVHFAHVACPGLCVFLLGLRICSLKDEFRTKDIAKLRSVAVAASSDLLLFVIVI
jgi:hypothetical protein